MSIGLTWGSAPQPIGLFPRQLSQRSWMSNEPRFMKKYPGRDLPGIMQYAAKNIFSSFIYTLSHPLIPPYSAVLNAKMRSRDNICFAYRQKTPFAGFQ